MQKMHKMEMQGQTAKHLWQDNTGENKKLQKRAQSADWKLNITFEYTAVRTPQQNSRAETTFPIVAGQSRLMLQHANVPKRMRYPLLVECVFTTTKQD